MKFAGLILICASSCLALLLPAIGVVKLPKMAVKPSASTAAPGQSVGLFSNNLPVVGNGSAPSWGSNQDQPNTTGSFPSLVPQNNPFTTSSSPASKSSDGSSSKLGLGIWLLLGPITLIGLAMWTFFPNPSGSSSKSK